MKKSRGFTLIEILVVVLIISITLGFALLSFGDFGEERRLVFAAEQLVNALELAQQQAILEGSTLGLYIDRRGYQILKFQTGKTWVPISNKNAFKFIVFPKNTVLSIKPNLTTIVMNPSGDMTPFVLTLGADHQITIVGKHNGSLVFTKGLKQ